MQRYIGVQAMRHKMRLRTFYYYGRYYDVKITAREFYKFEKERHGKTQLVGSQLNLFQRCYPKPFAV